MEVIIGGGAVGLTLGAALGWKAGGPLGAAGGAIAGGWSGKWAGRLGAFSAYARNIPHKSYPFPMVGMCGMGRCQGTVTLCNQCIDRSELGNMMYGIIARVWGIPFWLTLAAGWQFGGMDTTADEAVMAVGYNAITEPPPNGADLCDQINLWRRTYTNHAADPLTTGGCEPCAHRLDPATPQTQPVLGTPW